MQPSVNNNIFISIACWRDPLIYNTINSAINNSSFPNNLFFGIVFQGYKEDNYIIKKLKSIDANIKIIYIDAASQNASIYITELRGNISMKNYAGEKYFMQIDSHTKFAPKWDISLIAELELANEKFGPSVITTQSSDFLHWDKPFNYRPQTTLPDENVFNNIGQAVIGNISDKEKNYQILEKFFNANCLFCYSSTFFNIEYPNNIVFQYEQPVMSLVLWTGGYNLVSSTVNYVSVYNFHTPESNIKRIDRQADPRWMKIIHDEEPKQRIIYEKMFSNENDKIKTNKRSIKDYLNFIGYDPITLNVNKKNHEKTDYYYIDNYVLNNKIYNVYKKIKSGLISKSANYI